LADLERVCDHLILIAGARSVICAEIDDLLASHKVLSAPMRDTTAIEREHHVVTRTCTPREVSLTVKLNGPVFDPAWRVDDLGLEDIVLAYLSKNATESDTSLEVVR
jgi:ABC-2 type transport system ATP-binding protein